jgi:hypothetical protein
VSDIVFHYPLQRVLFKTIGLNIARCFKRSDGSYTLAGRELLYYVDPVTDQIINRYRGISSAVPLSLAFALPISLLIYCNFRFAFFYSLIYDHSRITQVDQPVD